MALPHEYVNAICEKYYCEIGEPVPPEYIGAARLIVLGAAAARQIRQRQKRVAEGQRITEWRTREGLSAGAAAKLLGVSRRELGRWESGEKRAPAWVWGRIFDRG